MSPLEYKWGVFFNLTRDRIFALGFGVVWLGDEKYVYFDLLFVEIAIGKNY